MFALRVFQKSGAFKKERYGDDLHNLRWPTLIFF